MVGIRNFLTSAVCLLFFCVEAMGAATGLLTEVELLAIEEPDLGGRLVRRIEETAKKYRIRSSSLMERPEAQKKETFELTLENFQPFYNDLLEAIQNKNPYEMEVLLSYVLKAIVDNQDHEIDIFDLLARLMEETAALDDRVVLSPAIWFLDRIAFIKGERARDTMLESIDYALNTQARSVYLYAFDEGQSFRNIINTYEMIHGVSHEKEENLEKAWKSFIERHDMYPYNKEQLAQLSLFIKKLIEEDRLKKDFYSEQLIKACEVWHKHIAAAIEKQRTEGISLIDAMQALGNRRDTCH